MAESYSVKAILSAIDRNFTSTMKSAVNATDSLREKVSGNFGAGILMGAGSAAFHALAAGAKSLVGEIDSANATWKTFAANMQMNGKSGKQIQSVKKDLQDFAEQTIYSSSDMASTYAQLDAVGTKSTARLVKGFGGLAAAADDPAQAMKTLSMQATQMAAKPNVAWQDFKLMLEQTPAGISAIAKQMGKETKELVADVQAGKVSTGDFFAAVTKVGTNKAFTELATQYKTVGQAMDGLKETLGNKLSPAFAKLSDIGIRAVEKVIDKLGGIDGEAVAAALSIDRLKDAAVALGAVAGGALAAGGMGKFFESLSAVSGSAQEKFCAKAKKISDAGKKMSAGVRKSLKKISFDAVTEKGAKGIDALRRSFQNAGEAVSGFGGGIARTMEAASGSLAGKGAAACEKFAAAGDKVSGVGGRIADGLSRGIERSSSALSAFAGKAKALVAPFSTVASGISKGVSQAARAGVGAMGKMSSSLVSLVGIALKAVAPVAVIGAAVAGLGVANSQFGEQISQLIRTAAEKGPQIISGLVSGITGKLPALIQSGAGLLSGLLDVITANLPAVLSGGTQIIQALVQGVSASIPQILPAAIAAVAAFAQGILGALPQLALTGMQFLNSLSQGIVSNSGLIMQSATGMVESFVSGVTSGLPSIISTGAEILANLAHGAVQMLPQLAVLGLNAVTSLVTSVSGNLPQILAAGVQILQTLIQGIVANLPQVLAAAAQAVMALVQGIGQNLPSILSAGAQAVETLVAGVAQLLPDLAKAGWDLIKSLAQGIAEAIPDVLTGAVKGIKDVFSSIWKGITGENTKNSKKSTESVSKMSDSVSGSMKSMASDVQGSSKTVAAASKSYSAAASSVQGTMAKTSGSAKKALNSMGKGYKATFNGMGKTATAGMGKVNSGIQKGGNKAKATASRAVKGVATAFRSGYGSVRSAGAYIGAGFASGMESSLGRIRSAAAAMAAAADQAVRAKAKISSPSRVEKKTGRYFAAGFTAGIKDGTRRVAAASRSLAKAAISTLKSAVSTRDYEGAADKALSAYQKRFERRSSKVTNRIKKTVSGAVKQLSKKNPKLKKSYGSLADSMNKQLSKAVTSYQKKAVAAMEKAMDALSKKYQERYDKLENDQQGYLERLSDYGSLYSADSYGFVSFTNFKEQTAVVKKLGQNMEKLKKSLPYDLMRDIQGMDTSAALSYTNELLKKGDKWLKQYGRDYSAFISTAKKTSGSYYQPYVKKLDTDYNKTVAAQGKKLKRQLDKLAKQMGKAGEQAAAGLVKGLAGKKATDALKKAAGTLSSALVEAFKGKLKIHSPSKVFESLSLMIGQGIINGIDSMGGKVSEAMEALVTVPQVSPPAFAGGFAGDLSSQYDYYRSAEYTIYVPVNLDGKEIARVIAPYEEAEISKRQARENRKNGRA